MSQSADQYNSALSQSELEVLESLHNVSEAISQRELARRTGFSVGLVNAVIKKLVRTGYVKTAHLNSRSISYLLTPSGFSETAMRSYRYMLQTVRSYKEIRNRLSILLDDLSSSGFSEFFLHGEGELAELVESFFEEKNCGVLRRGLPAEGLRTHVVLNAVSCEIELNNAKVIDLVSELGCALRKERARDK